jgi:glycosyltransferase involved in cell wall biosynthesis
MSAGLPRLRLLIDCHTFDVGPQGTTTFLAGVLNALPGVAAQAGGPNVELICAARSREAVERFLTVQFHYMPMTGGFLRRNAVVLPRLVRETSADWVVSQYVRPFRSRARTASVIHDVLFLDFPTLFGWSYRTIRRATFGWAARHSDAVIAVSEYSRDRIAHHFGRPSAAIDVVYNAVGRRFVEHAASPARTERAPGPLRLLMVSRLERRKRQEWCITAAVQLAHEGCDVVLDLVGTGHDAYADEVRSLAAAHPGIVRLHEGINDDALVAIYDAADLFLFPSECEGFGIPVIEAAALGLPCLVADNTALSELRPAFAGPSFTGSSAKDLADAIRTTLANIRTLRRNAQAARADVPALYNWNEAARQMLASLERRGCQA